MFTPITPCRILDTRLAGGRLAAGEVRAILVRGGAGGYAAQGGAADCGIPGLGGPPGSLTNVARAVSINVVAAGALGLGHLAAWPVGEPRRLESLIAGQPARE